MPVSVNYFLLSGWLYFCIASNIDLANKSDSSLYRNMRFWPVPVECIANSHGTYRTVYHYKWYVYLSSRSLVWKTATREKHGRMESSALNRRCLNLFELFHFYIKRTHLFFNFSLSLSLSTTL